MKHLQIPPIAEGETYIGCIGDAQGNAYHVILLPGDNADASWKAQVKWAKSIGGDLPNRIEQGMLFAHHRTEFKEDWYWSNETHASGSGYAWYQYFLYGTQSNFHKNLKLRARAVRRVNI